MTIITIAEYREAARKSISPSGIIRKDAPAEIVDVGTAEDRRVTFVVSTGLVDRDGDTIAVTGWDLDDYRRNPVVLWSHDQSGLPIAKCVEVAVQGDRLVATFEFVPADMPVIGERAEAVLRMLRSGFLAATSVGFAPISAEFSSDPDRRGGMDFTRQSLLEISVVTVPSNPEALRVEVDLSPEQRCREIEIQKIARARRARAVRLLDLPPAK